MRLSRFAVLSLVLLALPGGHALARDAFLSDGGGIRTQRVVGTPYGPGVIDVPALGEGRPFLEDGGGIRFAPDLPRYGTRPHYDAPRPATSSDRARRSSRSVVDIPDRDYGSRSVSVVVLNTAPQSGRVTESRPLGYGGAKVIRVSTARLDRRPFDASGIDVVYSGATKIIRLAPPADTAREERGDDATLELEDGANLASAPSAPTRAATGISGNRAPASQIATASQDETPTNVPSRDAASASTRQTAARETGDLEPWTEAWRSDCIARYPSFDPSLGTYRDDAGRRRFCTGEL